MNTKQTFVSFKNVKKSYDGKKLIVDNMNLDMKKGEFVSLLGPSGSGKTTCLMMLAGFENVTAGEILIDNIPVQNIPPNKRNIGMVFQNYALFPHMTVYENLAFPLEIRKLSKTEIKRKVQKSLEIVRLEDFGNRRIAQLSGGQQQRVAVARSITFEPEIVLMDEPLGALDKNLREEMQFEIKHMHENLGLTVLYVTHDQAEAITMSDRIAVFNDGIIQQYSTPSKMYEQPQNAFVANFIGENNSLDGTVVANFDQNCKVQISDNIEIIGLNVNDSKVGSKAMVSIRPEKVIVSPENINNDNLNIVTSKIEEIIYMGDHIRLRIKIAAMNEFIVKILNNEVKHQFACGDDLQLGWYAQHCCVLGK